MLVKDIVVFGTGTAGWVTAVNLTHSLPDCRITVMNPTNKSNIGVGESTQPNLVDFLHKVGINLGDFMLKTDATLKHGIYYNDWDEIGKDYWHPFTNMSYEKDWTTAHIYQQLINEFPEKYTHEEYYKFTHPSYITCVEQDAESFDMGFALHVDANKVAEYLREHISKYPNARVVDFEDYDVRVENNEIKSIKLNNQIITGDLWVDCSGFNKVLISKVSDCENDGYKGNVNTAIAGKIGHNKGVKTRFPYTRADAHANGWTWSIPLQSRTGIGWVYDREFTDYETEWKRFNDYWEGNLNEDDFKVIEFTSESLLNPFDSNVVAIGLSSGFVEPLEATGIAWFVVASQILTQVLRNRWIDQPTRNLYNSSIRPYIEDIQDFIDAHYSLSHRRDSKFWEYHTNKLAHSERLHNRLDLYRENMPNKTNRNTKISWAFNDVSWIDILNGYKFKYGEKNAS